MCNSIQRKEPGEELLEGTYKIAYNTSIKMGRDEAASDEYAKKVVKEAEKTWYALLQDDED